MLVGSFYWRSSVWEPGVSGYFTLLPLRNDRYGYIIIDLNNVGYKGTLQVSIDMDRVHP
jgi:hypothetical protein